MLIISGLHENDQKPKLSEFIYLIKPESIKSLYANIADHIARSSCINSEKLPDFYNLPGWIAVLRYGCYRSLKKELRGAVLPLSSKIEWSSEHQTYINK